MKKFIFTSFIIGIIIILVISTLYNNSIYTLKTKEKTAITDLGNLQKKVNIFASLNYKFSPDITQAELINEITDFTFPSETPLKKISYSELYYIFCHINHKNNCILWDLEFFDSSSKYI